MGNLFMWISVILLFLGLPASIILTILAFAKKNMNSMFKFSIPVVFFAIFFFCILGACLLPDTKVAQKEPIKTEEEAIEKETEVPKGETTKQEIISEEKPEKETFEEEKEQPKEFTESEYKLNCQEVYNDDVFKNKISVGKLVKIHVMASTKYKYRSSDMQGIIVEEITDKYNLEMNSLGCTVMHESTKDSATPSYFGDQLYIMFQKNSNFNLDTFKTGQKFVLYGEVIQNKNGTFVLPKYYEMEE